jgi:hypothetical protein
MGADRLFAAVFWALLYSLEDLKKDVLIYDWVVIC